MDAPIIGNGEKYQTNTSQVNTDTYQTILKINDVVKADYGQYKCTAINSLGEDTVGISMEPRGPPETPSVPFVVNAGVNWVDVGWTDGFNGGFDRVQYMLVRRVEGSSGQQEIDCRDQNPCNITGLSQHVTYSLQVGERKLTVLAYF